MSDRRALLRHARSLGEARDIVTSMKSLAFMETRRLARFLDRQRQVVGAVEVAAADFLSFYPDTLARADWAEAARESRILLVLGSERGFCGGFNESLVAALERELRKLGGAAGVVACGSRLCARLAGKPQLVASLETAAVTEEVEGALSQLVATLSRLQQEGALLLRVLYRDPEQEEVIVRDLLPPFASLPPRKRGPFAPQLNLSPRQFLLELVELHLYSALHEILYLSLMAENQARLRHLEGAVHYLDEQLDALRRRGNQLRQEEITEEIEVILLSASNLGGVTPAPGGEG